MNRGDKVKVIATESCSESKSNYVGMVGEIDDFGQFPGDFDYYIKYYGSLIGFNENELELIKE